MSVNSIFTFFTLLIDLDETGKRIERVQSSVHKSIIFQTKPNWYFDKR